MLPGQPRLERSGPGRGSAGHRVPTGRGLRGRRPRETATATRGRAIQKFRGKPKMLGNPIPSPLGFCSDCPRPIFSMAKPREPVVPRFYVRLLCLYVPTHTHTYIYTGRYVYVRVWARRARARRGAGTARLLRPRSPALPGETGVGRGALPAAASSAQPPSGGTLFGKGF